MHKQVLICLYLLREEKRIECLVHVSQSFHEILHQLKIQMAEERIIVEKESGFLCDPDVSLQSLGVCSCMRFLIY